MACKNFNKNDSSIVKAAGNYTRYPQTRCIPGLAQALQILLGGKHLADWFITKITPISSNFSGAVRQELSISSSPPATSSFPPGVRKSVFQKPLII